MLPSRLRLELRLELASAAEEAAPVAASPCSASSELLRCRRLMIGAVRRRGSAPCRGGCVCAGVGWAGFWGDGGSSAVGLGAEGTVLEEEMVVCGVDEVDGVNTFASW